MFYPEDFESKIGFDSVRASISSFCISRMGRDQVAAMSFVHDFGSVMSRLLAVAEMKGLLESESDLPLGSLHDVVPWLVEIRVRESFMTADRLYKLNSVLESMAGIRRFFFPSDIPSSNVEDNSSQFSELRKVVEPLGVFPDVSREINRCVNKFGEVKDSASERLAEIRRQLQSAQGSISRAMRRVLDRAVAEGIVDRDAAPSIRDGRMVLPVSSMQKRRLDGIVHDESATGKTVFIEPAEVVEAGNRIRELQMEEQREIVTVLRAVADFIRPHIDGIIEGVNLLGTLDFIRAKALFAMDTGAQMPVLEKNPELDWFHALHPVLMLSLRQQNREAVPLDLRLGGENRILVISGPNAGGKSVCLKTVAIVQYMAQCGVLPTLYSNSHMGIFRHLLIDIGDEQSIENDLSTYSSHLCNMKFFLSHADSHTLFLADEMGSGTEPQIGGALAQAILSELGRKGCFGVVTTHYQNLKTFAEETPGFVNGAMLYDRQHLRPTFRLSVGNPGSSFALEIARNTGLPAEVIDSAKQIVGSDYVNMEKYLLDIARDRRYWANKRQSIKEKEHRLDSLLDSYEDSASDLKSRRAAILKEAREEAKEILSTANATIERTIHEIRKAEAEKQRTLQLRKELQEYREGLEKEVEDEVILSGKKQLPPRRKRKGKIERRPTVSQVDSASTEFAVGDYVKMEDGAVPGKIISIEGKKAEVAFGALRTQVALSRLRHSSAPRPAATTQTPAVTRSTSEESRQRQLKFSTELDVRGMRADEALQAVTYFIDDAIQFSAGRVRILHGTGHGILRDVIRKYLRANPAVVSAVDEDVRFGGAGITVVELE